LTPPESSDEREAEQHRGAGPCEGPYPVEPSTDDVPNSHRMQSLSGGELYYTVKTRPVGPIALRATAC
jgi:hypothetical protein